MVPLKSRRRDNIVLEVFLLLLLNLIIFILLLVNMVPVREEKLEEI